MTPPTNIQTRIRQYVKSQNEDYYWDGKEAGQCRLLINKITNLYTNRRNRKPTDDEVFIVFAFIWKEFPKWITRTIPTLNSNFNVGIESIKKRSIKRRGEPLPEVGW